METAGRHRWLWVSLLVGIVYLVVGLGFASLAGQAGSQHMRVAWRLAAWVASAAAFAVHIRYEHVGLRNLPRLGALHCSIGVALGALALAIAANVHARVAAMGNRPLLAVALVAWPLLAGVPAFLVAWIAGAGLRVVRRSR